jgi:hypothetical protein
MLDLEGNVSAIQYDPQTGRIEAIRTGLYRDIAEEPYAFILGTADYHINYIDLTSSPPAVALRPVMQIAQDKTTITADGADTMTLSGLPALCRVTVGPETYDVPDGVLEWSALMPATYSIKVELFPYLDWASEVTVVASDSQTDG